MAFLILFCVTVVDYLWDVVILSWVLIKGKLSISALYLAKKNKPSRTLILYLGLLVVIFLSLVKIFNLMDIKQFLIIAAVFCVDYITTQVLIYKIKKRFDVESRITPKSMFRMF